jgi:hypothetical protein
MQEVDEFVKLVDRDAEEAAFSATATQERAAYFEGLGRELEGTLERAKPPPGAALVVFEPVTALARRTARERDVQDAWGETDLGASIRRERLEAFLRALEVPRLPTRLLVTRALFAHDWPKPAPIETWPKLLAEHEALAGSLEATDPVLSAAGRVEVGWARWTFLGSAPDVVRAIAALEPVVPLLESARGEEDGRWARAIRHHELVLLTRLEIKAAAPGAEDEKDHAARARARALEALAFARSESLGGTTVHWDARAVAQTFLDAREAHFPDESSVLDALERDDPLLAERTRLLGDPRAAAAMAERSAAHDPAHQGGTALAVLALAHADLGDQEAVARDLARIEKVAAEGTYYPSLLRFGLDELKRELASRR